MFPIRDSLRARRAPLVTLALLVLNLLGFAYEVQSGPAMEVVVTRFGVVPDRLIEALDAGRWVELGTVFSSMFLHGDLFHLLGNCWFLWIFGDNVEDRLGRAGFLAFYLVCGVAAAASQVAMDPTSGIPMIGASGAIAGVLGGYLRLYPGARVLAVLPIFFFLHFFEVRAIVFLGVWFGVQVVSSLFGASGVAWWAHIAGFVAGVVLTLPMLRPGGAAKRAPPRGKRKR
jgi:membrane associated rhomboid family serine protease